MNASPRVSLADTLRLMRRCGFRPRPLIVSGLLSFLSACFEGLTVGLLIPFIKGLIQMDFRFIHHSRYFQWLKRFPSLEASNGEILALLLGMIIVSALLKNVLQYWAALKTSRQVTALSDNMRRMLFDRYLSFSKQVFDKTSMGTFNTILTGHTGVLARELVVLQNATTVTLTLGAYIAAMLAISWQLTLLVLVVFPALHYSINVIVERINLASRSLAKTREALDVRIFNTLSCIQLVKAYTTEDQERDRFAAVSRGLGETECEIRRLRSLVGPVQEVILLVMSLVLFSAMFLFVMKGGVREIPRCLVYFYILKKATHSFGVWNNMKVAIATLQGPLGHLRAVFDDVDKTFVRDGELPFLGIQENIRFNRLSFSYQDSTPVLSDLDFSLERGKMTALVGATGAGKTTVINLILRFYDPPPEGILVDGRDIRSFTLKSFRERVALVSQNALLFNDSIKNNIIYGIPGEVSAQRLQDALKRACLDEFVASLPKGLDTTIGDHGHRLSGGEKQRLSIARAVLKNADILILDEATSALDSNTERLVQAAIEHLVKDKTCIVVAHRLSTIKNADKIVVMDKGRLVEEGTLAELLAKQKHFYRYWTQQRFS
ncbi:MAG: ABC transporter ATP-binding protein [Elusimicrobia bacterium]|nr:ABC transporter ATP-binding protein [Elusimicrobiota bacterium]